MNYLDKLEKKFGKFAIKNLMTYIVLLNGIVLLLIYLYPQGNVISSLMLIPSLVMKGQIWRLITFAFIPPDTSIFWALFALYFYYLIGAGLEQEWGSFKFNIYYFMGMIATIIAAFITGGGATAQYINMSLFLAFAYIYPDFEILLFFILPVKVKYLAWLYWAFIGYSLVFQSIPLKVAALASIVNFLVFFGREIFSNIGRRKKVYDNRKHFDYAPHKKTYIHKCTVCGITEKDNPNMEFRYCSKCDGDHEYCMDHLYNHEHIKGNKK